MAVAPDPAEELQSYAHPERLVTTGWLAEHLDDPDVVVVESDEDVLLYDTGHIPGAVKIDWQTELNDSLIRDYRRRRGVRRALQPKGIGRDSTVVFYGDNFNWWAAYALWVFRLFGHEDAACSTAVGSAGSTRAASSPRHARARADRLPGGRARRLDDPGVPRRGARPLRLGDGPLIDVRSPEEYRGELLHMPDYPQEGALRGGHIPGARQRPVEARCQRGRHVPLGRGAAGRSTRTRSGSPPSDDVIAYCRIGERSSHTWFVLQQLLGYQKVRNYDGSWTEWGNLVRAPIER